MGVSGNRGFWLAMTERKSKTVMKLVCKLPEEQVRPVFD
jgi:hypothetical protein